MRGIAALTYPPAITGPGPFSPETTPRPEATITAGATAAFFVGLAMAFSSVSVVASSLRLRRFASAA